MFHVSRFTPDPTRFAEFLACLWQGDVPESLVLSKWLYLPGEPRAMLVLWEGDAVAPTSNAPSVVSAPTRSTSTRVARAALVVRRRAPLDRPRSAATKTALVDVDGARRPRPAASASRPTRSRTPVSTTRHVGAGAPVVGGFVDRADVAVDRLDVEPGAAGVRRDDDLGPERDVPIGLTSLRAAAGRRVGATRALASNHLSLRLRARRARPRRARHRPRSSIGARPRGRAIPTASPRRRATPR